LLSIDILTSDQKSEKNDGISHLKLLLFNKIVSLDSSDTVSFSHLESHPSPSFVFQSSHFSSHSIFQSPQTATTGEIQEDHSIQAHLVLSLH
jgi:hypothetical protein